MPTIKVVLKCRVFVTFGYNFNKCFTLRRKASRFDEMFFLGAFLKLLMDLLIDKIFLKARAFVVM